MGDATSADTISPPMDAPAGDTVLTDAPPPGDAGAGGAAFRGAVQFTETFEDTNFTSRGWYDGPRATLSTTEHIPGSARSFECRYAPRSTGCAGGMPARHLFTASNAVYLSYWVKYSANFVGSGRAYHPHEFHFITNVDDRFIGPARTHLTTYIEQTGGVPMLALQDGLNVDARCILRNDDSFVGCAGAFSTFVFSEMRSVCACNGLMGDVDGRDCFDRGGGAWYSSRAWRSRTRAFSDVPGRYDRNAWHFVEAYFRLNTIAGGVGVPDGAIRYWFDGETLISSDRVLMRTAQHPMMQFNQFLVAPYIGDGSPVDQTMWVDDLTVAQGT